MAPQAASSSSSHLNALGWWRGCAAPYQPQLRLWLLARPSAATTAPASVRAGASRCGQIQTKSPQIPLEEFPFASEPSQLGSPWSTSTWVYRAHQACPVLPWPSARVALGRSWGCWGYPALPAGQWVLVLLPSMTKSLIKQPGLWTQTCSVSYLVHGKCVWALCVSPPRGVQLPTFCIPHPPNTNFSSSSLQSFQNFSKSTLPSSLFQDLNFFLSISQLSAAAVLLSFWWKAGYQSLPPQLHTFKFRPPHLQGTFKLGIKHCTWQRFPDPAQNNNKVSLPQDLLNPNTVFSGRRGQFTSWDKY